MSIVSNPLDKQFLDKIKKIHSFKIFKKSTKFKKYNKGITRFIMNRKRYSLRKKKTSLFYKFVIPLIWTSFISKKKQSIRFYQNYKILSYTIPAINARHLLSCYDAFIKNTPRINSEVVGFNLLFLSKKIFSPTTLFRLQTLKSLLNLFNFTKVGFVAASNFNVIKEAITPSYLAQDKNIIMTKQINKEVWITRSITVAIVNLSILFVRNIRQILTKLTLFIMFL